MLIFFLVAVSFPGFVTVLSADESSSAPALADSGGIFLFGLFVAVWGDPVHFQVTEPAVMDS